MYNRYLDQPVAQSAPPSDIQPSHQPRGSAVHQDAQRSSPEGHRRPAAPGEFAAGPGALLGGVLKGLSNQRFDAGDVLLVLIILLLFLEGDDLEIIITLALMLLLGLDDQSDASAFPPA